MGAYALVWLCAALISTDGLAQTQHYIQGTIVDATNGKGIANATVYSADEDRIYLTNELGEFAIPTSQEYVRLHVQHIGYLPDTLLLSKAHSSLALRPSLRLLEEITIRGLKHSPSIDRTIDMGSPENQHAVGVADIFRDVPGFGLIKRGGYAVDPVFRSFKYQQLNLIFDGGTTIANACPNRMDPASTHISAAEVEQVQVIKGPYTVRYGQSMGATINMITRRPKASDVLAISGQLEGGYVWNGNGVSGRGLLNVADKHYQLSLHGSATDYGDYHNGEDNTVPSAFRVYDYAAKLGVSPAANQYVQFTWRQSFGRDIRHASLPMDTEEDNSTVVSVDYEIKNLSPVWAALSTKIYYSSVDHLMTNTSRPNFAMVEARSPVTSANTGGRVELTLQPSGQLIIFAGSDLRMTANDGQRNRLVKMMNGIMLPEPRAFTDLIWQDSWIRNLGLFGEINYTFSPRWEWAAGMRMDATRSGIDNPAPDFAALYEGLGTDNNLGFNFNTTLNRNIPNGVLQLAIGRGRRPAELLERYINHFQVGIDGYEYVGNPNLSPEVNNQVDIMWQREYGRFNTSINVFYSFIEDYISAEVDSTLPRKFMPQLEPRYARRFINVERANQLGFELEAGYQLNPRWHMRGVLFYTRAQNEVLNEPLPEIPPLTGMLSARYAQDLWWASFSGKMVSRQNRVSQVFAESVTPGYSVFDVEAGVQVSELLTLTGAIRNMFDANYFDHLNRPFQNYSENGMFYESGRQVQVSAKLSF